MEGAPGPHLDAGRTAERGGVRCRATEGEQPEGARPARIYSAPAAVLKDLATERLRDPSGWRADLSPSAPKCAIHRGEKLGLFTGRCGGISPRSCKPCGLHLCRSRLAALLLRPFEQKQLDLAREPAAQMPGFGTDFAPHFPARGLPGARQGTQTIGAGDPCCSQRGLGNEDLLGRV